jgi:proline iminopeptidase
METIRLGGVEQSVWVRARDVQAPPLILLHGGPGASEAALFRR